MIQSNIISQSLDNYINYTVEDGLPSNLIYDMIEDSRGFIWFGTDAGVSRYDGYRFSNFTVQDGLGDNEALEFFKDSKDRIWIYSLNGSIAYIDGDNIVNQNDLPFLKGEVFSTRICGIAELPGENIVITENTGKVIAININKSTVHTLQLPATVNHLFYTDISSNKFNVIGGLEKFEVQLDNGLKLLNRSTYVSGSRIPFGRAVIMDSVHLGIASTFSERGFSVVNLVTNSVSTHPTTDYEFCNNVDFVNGQLSLFTSSGLYSFIDDSFQKIYEGNLINYYKDQFQNEWFSTRKNGVYLKRKQLINRIDFDVEPRYISSQGDSLLIVGLANGSIHCIKEQEVDHLFTIDRPGFGQLEIAHIDKQKQIFGGGNVIVVNGEIVPGSGLRDAVFYDNRYLIGSRYGLIDLEEIKITGGIRGFTKPFYDLRELVRVKTYGKDLFLSHSYGMVRLSEADTVELSTQFEQLRVRIPDFIVDEQGILWIATDGNGIFRIEGDSIWSISQHDGLVSNSIKAIARENEYLWAATNNGLNRVNLENGRVDLITADDGLGSNLTSQLGQVKGKLYVRTDNALHSINTRSSFRRNYEFPFFFASIREDNQSRDYKPEEVYSFEPGTKNLTFEYLCLDYGSFGNVNFRYQVLDHTNLDSSIWIDTKSRSVSLWNLKSGSYTLRVMAQPVNADWTEPLALEFVLRPYFWETRLFTIVVILAVLSMVSFIVWRIQVRRQVKLELDNQLISSELKALRAQINPHFLFNALNSIQKFILKDDFQTADSYLAKFSKLMRQTLEHSDVMLLTIEEEIKTLELYLQMETLRANVPFTYKVTVSEDIDPYNAYIPAMILQPFVENAIWHGVASVDDGKIEINFQKKLDHISITISDNGPGFSKSAENTLHQSMGISLIRDRLKMLGKYYHKSFHLAIHSQDEGHHGTKVHVVVPDSLF